MVPGGAAFTSKSSSFRSVTEKDAAQKSRGERLIRSSSTVSSRSFLSGAISSPLSENSRLNSAAASVTFMDRTPNFFNFPIMESSTLNTVE